MGFRVWGLGFRVAVFRVRGSFLECPPNIDPNQGLLEVCLHSFLSRYSLNKAFFIASPLHLPFPWFLMRQGGASRIILVPV